MKNTNKAQIFFFLILYGRYCTHFNVSVVNNIICLFFFFLYCKVIKKVRTKDKNWQGYKYLWIILIDLPILSKYGKMQNSEMLHFSWLRQFRSSRTNVRSSRLEVFCKKSVLRNSAKFTRKHLGQNLFVNKVGGWRVSKNKESCIQFFRTIRYNIYLWPWYYRLLFFII